MIMNVNNNIKILIIKNDFSWLWIFPLSVVKVGNHRNFIFRNILIFLSMHYFYSC